MAPDPIRLSVLQDASLLDDVTTVGAAGYALGMPKDGTETQAVRPIDSALFSGDGIAWASIDVPGSEPYPTLSILRDRLLALSANRPRENQPTQIDICVGEIE